MACNTDQALTEAVLARKYTRLGLFLNHYKDSSANGQPTPINPRLHTVQPQQKET